MAGKKEKSAMDLFSDLLVKLTNVFSPDLYIFCNTYVIGGDESREEIAGEIHCMLTSKFQTALNEINPDKETIFIKNIRETKKDLSLLEYGSTTRSLYYKEIVNHENELIRSQSTWNTLTLSEEDRKKFFDQMLTINLFEDRDDIPTLICGKAAFPLLSEKNMDHFYWTYTTETYLNHHEELEIPTILTTLDFDPYFQIFGRYTYLSL